ncbi:MAG TPA: hypothetical protein EYM77_04505 [Dehalococcoidia bacterium]|nr:hypothetical protein [Dehalococcoidia bacterium]
MIGCGGKEEEGVQDTDFAPVVEEVLQNKIDLVKRLIAANPRIIESITNMNEANKNITFSEIKKLDDDWMTTGAENKVKDPLSNDASNLLMEFQDDNDGFSEIFITDANGQIAALTNKTSDYYQAVLATNKSGTLLLRGFSLMAASNTTRVHWRRR